MSGNPGGRPQGLGKYIRAQTINGEELVDLMLSVLRGELTDDVRIRAQAATWLADRSFGRPMMQKPIESNDYYSTQPIINGQDPLTQLKEKLESVRERLLPTH